jgi:hypothetical protein
MAERVFSNFRGLLRTSLAPIAGKWSERSPNNRQKKYDLVRRRWKILNGNRSSKEKLERKKIGASAQENQERYARPEHLTTISTPLLPHSPYNTSQQEKPPPPYSTLIYQVWDAYLMKFCYSDSYFPHGTLLAKNYHGDSSLGRRISRLRQTTLLLPVRGFH